MSGPAGAPRVAVVVVSHETCDELLRCLRALEALTIPAEIVVVDNSSRDGSPEAVRGAFPRVRLVQNARNEGYGAAVNRGARATSARYILVLNSDAEIRPGAVETLVALLDRRPDVGAAGPLTRNEDGSVQPSFGADLALASEWRQRRLVRGAKARRPAALREAAERAVRESEPDWLSGSCLLVRRGAFEAVGGFDEGFFLYEEDADLCRRLRQEGWRIVFTPAAEVVHRLGASMAKAASRSALEYHRSHLRYYAKHNAPWQSLLLRVSLAGRGALGWLAALGSGSSRAERRRCARALLRLALGRGEAPLPPLR